MRIRSSVRILLTFYKTIAGISTVITLLICLSYYEQGYQAIVSGCWLKLVSYALFIYFINHYKRKELYYYYNLGFSKIRLWSAVLIFDFGVMAFLLTLTKIFR